MLGISRHADYCAGNVVAIFLVAKETLGAFHCNKHFGFNFQTFPFAKGTAFWKISGKGDNIARETETLTNLLQKIPVRFDFAPGISRIFG